MGVGALASVVDRLSFTAAIKGADIALRVPGLRNWLLQRAMDYLDASYRDTIASTDQQMHLRWFGRHLRPFLFRLVNERPAAARAVLRFVSTWARDMYRRDRVQLADGAAPCTVVIEPTDRCNLRCPGCYANSSSDGSDLPFDQMVQIVRQVIDMGVTLITISGGEPFLREKADRTISRLGEMFPNQGFLVYTNGTLIDDEIAERLGEVGNVFPAISVEGFEEQTDHRRGEGVYAKSRQVRQRLADQGVMYGFSATITRENAQAICTDRFIEQRLEEGDMFGWFFLLQPIGRHPRPDLMPSAAQRQLLRDTVYRWRAEDRPLFMADFWNDGHLSDGCMAGGRYYFHLYANGDISPCVFSPVALGNIFDIINGKSPYKSLNDFVQNHPFMAAIRRAQTQVTERSSPCLLIDHPHLFRQVCADYGYKAAKNMPADYFDGPIASAITAQAQQWKAAVPNLPPLPAQRET